MTPYIRRSWLSVGLLALGALGLSCSSTGLRPGTGDLSFRLTWSGVADLDLYVASPVGERIDFLHREVESGGRLDIDCNVRRVDLAQTTAYTTRLCEQPMENIYWPRGRAPRGLYRYWAVVANAEGATPSDTFHLEVRRGERVVRRQEGAVLGLVDTEVGGVVEWAGDSVFSGPR